RGCFARAGGEAADSGWGFAAGCGAMADAESTAWDGTDRRRAVAGSVSGSCDAWAELAAHGADHSGVFPYRVVHVSGYGESLVGDSLRHRRADVRGGVWGGGTRT